MIAREVAWDRLQNVMLLLLLLSFCLYLPTLTHYAFADDEIYLAYANKLLRSAQWSELYRLLLERANPWEFLPVRDISYWLDFRLYGDEPSGFHLSNLIWYAACCCATFWLFREIIFYCRPNVEERSNVFALAATALFALHPAHVESVAWIASRKDLMAGTFGFLSLACTVHAVRRSERGDGIRGDFLALAGVLYLLACFSKAAAILNALLMVVVLFAGYRPGRARERSVQWGAALLFMSIAAFSMAIHFSVARDTGIGLVNTPGMPEVLERASRIQVALIGILLFPHPLQFYYDVYAYAAWHWLVSGLALALAGAAYFAFMRQRKLWAFGVLLMIVPTTIYLQLSPFTTWSLASERFVFVSVAGLTLLIVNLFLELQNPRLILVTMLIFASVSGYLVWERVQEWEYGYQMLGREYQRRPTFHNAIRDQIAFVLLPNKRYEEAKVLAGQVQRPYAANALLSLIEAERTYRELRDAPSVEVRTDSPALRRNFCEAVTLLRQATRDGYSAMTAEPDVSYNNILRTLDKFESQRFADAKSICATLKDALSEQH